jgi:two-component system sensor histidine kinase YesM
MLGGKLLKNIIKLLKNIINSLKYLIKKMKQYRSKPLSLRKTLLFLVVISWIVPVSIIFIFISMSYRNSIISKTEDLMEEGLKNFTSFHAQKIDNAITISKKTSYELVIENAWRGYNAGKMKEATFKNEIISNLKSKFTNDNRFVMSALYLCDDLEQVYPTSRYPQAYIDTYIDEVIQEAYKITKEDTSDAHVKIIDGRLFIIRNLYTTRNYTKFATLIVELDTNKLFAGNTINKDYELGFYIDDIDSLITYNSEHSIVSREIIVNKLKEHYNNKTNRNIIKIDDTLYTGLLYQQKCDDYNIGAYLVADKTTIYSELKDLTYIMLLILLIVIPVFIYMLYFIAKHITTPMSRMIKASKELEKGNIGMTIEGNPMPNEEFSYLHESFNRMSLEVKYLFDYAYNEKLARKEAKIIALQSQINPHFLNNTLEMMNWQARMSGDIEVSKMIEALGTLLDYTMDRSNKKFISLSEELRCADAYFYIISMRFGQRLRIEKEIDKELLQIQVPQLILQPILENAVVHGIETVNNGVIKLKIWKKEDNLLLQITNTGKGMTKEDVERVRNILVGKGVNTISGKGKHVSLGIRNVNERIKLIYGDEYGLDILPAEGDETETISTITIPYEMKINVEKEKLLKKLLGKSK